jgi:hypothetical protein
MHHADGFRQRWHAGWLVVLLALSLPPVHEAVAQDGLVRKAQCRLTVGTSIRHYASALLIRIGKCHHLRLGAKIPATVDCNAPASWAAAGYAAGAAAWQRDRERLRSQMAECRPTPQTPPEVGYTTCPAPCAGLPAGTFPEVGACLECLADACVLAAAQDVLGVPPLPIDSAARKCQATVGRRMVVYLNKTMLMQQDCEFRKEVQQPLFTDATCIDLDDAAHPYATKIGRARDKVAGQVGRRCSSVDLEGSLDTCGTDPVGEGACAMAAIDQCSGALFEGVYPPLP